MLKVKSCLYFLGISVMVFLAACGGDEQIVETVDAVEQARIDSVLIADYLALNNYEDSLTDIGVRLVVTEQGNSRMAQEGDVIQFDFAGRFLNRNDDDEVIDTAYFDTTIFSVANAELGVEEDNPIRYRPVVYTYSDNGWTLTAGAGGSGFIVGFRDGVTELLKIIGVGGAGEIILPSRLAYGPSGTTGINPNQNIIFEIYLLSAE